MKIGDAGVGKKEWAYAYDRHLFDMPDGNITV